MAHMAKPKAAPARRDPKKEKKRAVTPGVKVSALPEVRPIPEPEVVQISTLKPHPRNYREHPEDQVKHLVESITRHGIYRNIVVARDGTILAGHGVVKAATSMGRTEVPVIRLDLAPDDPLALKLLVGDNELGHLGDRDERLLSELLKEVSTADISGLLGTGYDEMMLANLLYVSRPASEIADIDEAKEWAGMPEYEEGSPQIKLIITFPSAEDRKRFVAKQKMRVDKVAGLSWSTRWPWAEREDVAGLKFEARSE